MTTCASTTPGAEAATGTAVVYLLILFVLGLLPWAKRGRRLRGAREPHRLERVGGEGGEVLYSLALRETK